MRLREKLYEFTGDQCPFGLRGPRGGLHRKPTRYLSDIKELEDALSVKCDGTHEHEPVLGSGASEEAGHYPWQMAAAIVKAAEKHFQKS